MARVVISDCLRPSERSLLAGSIGYREFDDPLVRPVIESVRSQFDVTFASPSYVRVESRKEGHDWHCDNGKHMPWCSVSGSILLVDKPLDGVGGTLEFSDEVPVQRPGDLWLWDTAFENRHRVLQHNGWRVCLLLFLASAAEA